jgi:D-3-phosphoglycerate dehydrogenase / 2-oxoglutarate reductase
VIKVVVAEPVAQAGVELLRAQTDFDVVVTSPKEYASHLADCEALLVRSAVKVTPEVLKQAPKLRVIGRAGVGVDNVDLDAATAAGVLVMNTPGGNAISVAEHTVALILSLARAIPNASASTKSGAWEKKKFLGNEVRGKTLGVVGLGAIGREVVRRVKPFEMSVVGFDPFVNPQAVADLGVELVATLEELYAKADFITLHVAVTPETEKMLNASAFEKMKPGVRIVNCARGELIDTASLDEALESGKVGGAALDVFEEEPPAKGFSLYRHANLIATPHIGGSTEEAQEIVGTRIVEQVVEYLKSGVAINAVNVPPMSPEQYKLVGPYLALAERLGQFASHLAEGNYQKVNLKFSGRIAEMSTALLRNAALAGLLKRSTDVSNVVNSMSIAEERGIAVVEERQFAASFTDTVAIELKTDAGVTAVEGGLVLGHSRLLQVDGVACEAELSGSLVYMRNVDVPGVIGHVGNVLGENGINIANFSLGRQRVSESGQKIEAIAVVSTDGPVADKVLNQLKSNSAVKIARCVQLPV